MTPEPAIAPLAPVSRAEFRAALGEFPTGITVVTTVLDGIDHAMTANAFTSVSLDPLLVLVCVEKITRFHEAVQEAGVWGVSVLAAGAEEAARWFATRGRPLQGQLDRYPFRRGIYTGVPLLTASLSTLECRTYASYDGGDHTIVVGEVLAARVEPGDGRPLLYYRGRYDAVDDGS